MALHEHTPEEKARIQEAREVPNGAVGAAIEDEEPGRIKQFFTNPANLATLLVLGTALSKKKGAGQSGLNQLLSAGTGALAFRGGLTQEVRSQAEESTEAASVVTSRESTAANQRGQVSAVREATLQRGVDVQSQIRSAEELAAEDIASRERLARQAQVMQGFLDAANNYPNVVRDLTLSGLEPPTYDEYLLQVAKAAALGGATTGPEFRPDPTEVVIPGPLADTGEAEVAARAALEASASPVRPLPGMFEGGPFRKLTEERLNQVMVASLKRALPEQFGGLPDAQIIGIIAQRNADIEDRLATMTQEEAAQAFADPINKRVLSTDNLKAVRRRASVTSASIRAIEPRAQVVVP